MRIKPDDRRDGWTVNRLLRRRGEPYTKGWTSDRLWLVDWKDDQPVWSETQPEAPVVFHRDVVDELKARGVPKLYPDQPYWYEGHGSEDVALDDIVGADYLRHLRDG